MDKIAKRIFPLALVVLVLLVFFNSLQNKFLLTWDDNEYIVNNEVVQGWSGQHIRRAFTSKYAGNYAPIHIISYMLDHSIWGLNPAGFRLTNILIHAVNALLVFILISRLNGSMAAAAIGAVIFAVHPVQVESVVWISQRKNVLSLLFFLISLLLYLRYNSLGRWKDYIASLSVFLLALLTKSIAVVLPVIIISYHIFLEHSGGIKNKIRWVLPYFYLSLIFSGIAFIAQIPGVAGVSAGGGLAPYYGGSPYATFLTMIPVLIKYIKMVLFPFNLSVLYSPQIYTKPSWEVLAAAFALILMLGIVIYSYRFQKYLLFWTSWFFICLVPVLQIIPIVTIMNDRYLYYSLIGVSGLTGHFIASFYYKTNKRKYRLLLIAGLSTVCLLFCSLTMERNKVWRENFTLWQDAARKSPDKPAVLINLGATYIESGFIQEAIRSFNQCIGIAPEIEEPYFMLGGIFLELNQYKDAEENIRKAISLKPGRGLSYAILGKIYAREARYEEAWEAFKTAAAKDEKTLISDVFKGSVEFTRRELITQYRKIIETDPADVGSRFKLGNLYLSKEQIVLAQEEFEEILKLEPEHIGALNNMATIYMQQKKWGQAEEILQRMIKIDKNLDSAYLNLGMLYLEQNQKARARENLEKALTLANNPERQNNIRIVLRKIKKDE